MLRPSLRSRADGGPGRAARWLAVAAVLQLSAGVGAVVLVEPPPAGLTAPTAAPPTSAALAPRARVAPPEAASDPGSAQWRAAREAAVRALLATRSAAVLDRDEQAFLSVVDPAAPALRARQAALFAALEQVPIGTWRYVLSGDAGQPGPDGDLRWTPAVVLEHALEGFDDRPVVDPQHLTFVQRDGRWWLGADELDADGRTPPQALWDQGPVVAERADGVLVLGRPADRRLLRDVAALTATALPDVTAAWGSSWARRVVVLVPGDEEELGRLLATRGDLSRIAAVATADLAGGGAAFDPVGDRIVINPGAFRRLTRVGRQLVLTHELTHVATRRATGPAVPVWLAEGYADHVAHAALDLPLSLSASELGAEVREGRLPDRLPADGDFAAGAPALAQSYEQAWLAVRLLAVQHGEAGLLRFYRAVGARRGVDPAVAVEDALRAELGTTTAQLTTDWRASLQRDLG